MWALAVGIFLGGEIDPEITIPYSLATLIITGVINFIIELLHEKFNTSATRVIARASRIAPVAFFLIAISWWLYSVILLLWLVYQYLAAFGK